MSDIDFEELDKAVTSLMGSNTPTVPQKQEETTPSPAQAEPTTTVAAEIDTPEVTVPAPEVQDSPVSARAAETVVEPQTQAPVPVVASTQSTESLATKRRGQFMDMKHPSADMTTVGKPATPSRVGMTIAPTETIEVPEVVAEEQTTTDEVSTETPDVPVETAAPSSPFLPDAKVEKRPLGSPAAATATESVPIDMSDILPPAEGDDEATVDSLTLPNELHPSVLQVESDSTYQPEDESPAVSELEATAAPEVDEAAADEVKLSERPSPVDAKDEILQSKKDAILESASIPPQYKVKDQPVAGPDEPHANLYDSAADHPATFDSPKKSSHLGVIIMIVVLIILGAGGGAVLYLYQAGSLGF